MLGNTEPQALGFFFLFFLPVKYQQLLRARDLRISLLKMCANKLEFAAEPTVLMDLHQGKSPQMLFKQRSCLQTIPDAHVCART